MAGASADRIPILKMGDVLLVTIQIDMNDAVAIALQDDLTRRIVDTTARGVLIDISALEIVDSFIGRMLVDTAAAARLLGAVTVVVGMQPAIATRPVRVASRPYAIARRCASRRASPIWLSSSITCLRCSLRRCRTTVSSSARW